MNNYHEHHGELKDKAGSGNPYQSRRSELDRGRGERNRWWIFPVFFLLVAGAAAGLLLVISSIYHHELPGCLQERLFPGEESLPLNLPEALFVLETVEAITTGVIGEQGMENVAQGDDGTLIYMITAAEKDRLIEKAEARLEEKITAMSDERQHPYIISIDYEGLYQDFFLLVKREQVNRALVSASELYILAVFYQLIQAAVEPDRGITVTLEDNENGSIMEELVYPDDLHRAAAVIRDGVAPVETPGTPQPGDKVVVSTGPDNLNLRSGPEITYLIIDILRSGTVLEVTGKEGLWLEVITPEGKEGWVHGNFVEIYSQDN